ncbi:MAG TPA: hypothetical protein PL110_04565 [Candidatus Eremiobacteraeota bacterium]|nr:hypothetical protein [Candidatus Eremiobacteraeota bacterium]
MFNRPGTAQQVFQEIRKAKPVKLYVAADGPRENRKDDIEKFQATRDIIKQVDWDCGVHTLFQEKNLGCKLGPLAGINWFFEHEEEGIILEDDCLPSQSFFSFCQELLDFYRTDNRIMHISGNNFLGKTWGNGSYYFSKYSLSWGWATWRRAWKYYDPSIKTFPDFKKEKQIQNIFTDRFEQKYWLKLLQKVYDGKIDKAWDYQWTYTVWTQNGLAVLPNFNLVSNIGFGEGATHTTSLDSRIAHIKTEEIKEIIHPTFTIQNKEADKYIFINNYGGSLKSIIKSEMADLIPVKIKTIIKK